jgi:cytochrome c biogenesis protein ResB
MTVDGHTEEFWIRRSASLDAVYQPVTFPTGAYEIAYDTDRKDLGFELKLDDFEVGFDPGTEKASSFASQVRLTDEAMGIRDKPITISMNEPLTHRQWTFYQSRYER